nr:prenytransferase [Hypericum perforatum]
MDPSLLPSSSLKLSGVCSFQSSNRSSLPFKVKNIATGQLLSVDRLLRNPQILPAIRLHEHQLFGCSNVGRNCQIKRPNAMQNQDPDHPGLEKKPHFTEVLLRFTRPYALRGAIAGYTCILARTCIEHPLPFRWSQLFKALGGLVALLSAHSYINGVNQIFDVEIDRINKPHLPIASGDLSLQLAWSLVTSFAVTGLAIARILNYVPFSCSLFGLYFLGTIYSVPPFSMKRSTVGAILVNAMMGGLVLTSAQSTAARASLGLPFVLSVPVLFFSIFTTMYSSGLAITKDLSDVEGDRKFNVPTMATILGIRNTALIGSGILLLNYVGAVLTAIVLPQIFRRNVMVLAHTILGVCLTFQAWKMNRENCSKEESSKYYQFLWKLLYAEYALFPFI